MGTTQAQAFAEAIREGELAIASALAYHLSANHYPAVPLSMVPVCIEALAWAEDDERDAKVALPEGITWRGEAYAPVWAIIEAHHLEPFIG